MQTASSRMLRSVRRLLSFSLVAGGVSIPIILATQFLAGGSISPDALAPGERVAVIDSRGGPHLYSTQLDELRRQGQAASAESRHLANTSSGPNQHAATLETLRRQGQEANVAAREASTSSEPDWYAATLEQLRVLGKKAGR